jgi:hypothetical protein
MRGWFLAAALALSAGCGQPPAVLQAGDEVRPEVAFAPKAPWREGDRVTLGMLLQVHRPGRAEFTYLGDKDVAAEQAEMRARVTFLNGDTPLAEPLDVPFVKDC